MSTEGPDTVKGDARCDEVVAAGVLQGMDLIEPALTHTRPVSPRSAREISLYATWARRCGSWLVDLTVLAATIVALSLVWTPAGALAFLFLPVAYATVCHGGRRGQTVGKRLLKISVRDDASLGRLGYWRALGRWIVTAVFWSLLLLPGVVDVLAPLWGRKRQAWHDKAVGSAVIRL
jgi:uncharacterized RDD family membrane protein YckC